MIRLSIGASDLSDSSFTYNDLAHGETDIHLSQFSLKADSIHVIPILKEIYAIQPNLRIIATPWSAPAWMKTNQSLIGGSLKQKYEQVYAVYLAT